MRIQAIAEEVILRQKEIELEEKKVKVGGAKYVCFYMYLLTILLLYWTT